MAGSIDKGMFNFQGVMNKFYNYQPQKDDSEGRAIKNSFMANMIQSGFDAQMAKDMAQTQSSLAKSNMITAADLEARNTKANMDREFNYGMQTMGAQFKLQNQFADNQYKRDLGMQAAANLEGRKNIGAQGAQDRLTSVVQGEQQRLNTREQGKFDVERANISAEASKYGAKTAADASKYGADKSAQASMYGADKSAQASMYGADKSAQASMYGADKQLEGIKDTNLTSTRNIEVTGDQQRETMREGNRLEAKTRADQSRYSRQGARSF